MIELRHRLMRWPLSLFSSKQKHRPANRRIASALEQLEPRMMLAADLAAMPDVALATAPASVSDVPSAAHALFAPGTSPETIAQFEQNETVTSGLAEYQATKRWETTSTDGGGLDWGDATTITWSIAPDGTSIPGFVGETGGASNFIAMMSSNYGAVVGSVAQQPWFSIVESVFGRWGEVSGLTFVYEPQDDGAAFSNIASTAPGVSGVRGDIRIGGHAIDGDSGTLAYNFFPNNGEMILDTSDSFFADTSGNSLRLRNVMAHELGHGIGLSHVDPVDQTKLMEPLASTAFDGPQHDDILAVQRLYGDPFEEGGGNNSFRAAVDLGSLSRRSVSIGDLADEQYVSIDGATDDDYFRFTAGAGARLDAALIPLGTTYQQGAVDTSVSSFNSKTQNNLTLEIYDATHRLVARAARRGLGGSESLSDVALDSGGEYFVRIRGDRDAAQFYQLDLTVSAGATRDTIDFYEYTLGSYGGTQDHSGEVTIGNSGSSLQLSGNRWKKIDFSYSVTPDTVLEFDFSSNAMGDVHGIGFDSNTSISSGLTFRLFGTQNWGLDDFATYDAAGGEQHFVIPVGQFYTGSATSLVFVNDHDVAGATAESVFSNVRVYEAKEGAAGFAQPQAADDHIAVNEDSPTIALNALANDDDGGAALSITGVSAASAGGSASLAADGRIHYRPAADFNGNETFSYTATGPGGTSTAHRNGDRAADK